MALVEMLIASVTTEIGDAGRKRMEELERTRRVFDAAERAELDSPPAAGHRASERVFGRMPSTKVLGGECDR
jgi:hypothetical protein